MRSYHLLGAPNARDLGGIRTADGREICKGRIIRSGELSSLTEQDKAVLACVPLKTVVDFRTAQERTLQPDVVMEGVSYIACPILESMGEGITREAVQDEIPPFFRSAIRAGMEGENKMTQLYIPLVESDFSVSHYGTFLRLVLEHDSGAILYHCTAGKDRVGIGTMLLLTALGVSREMILEDYLLTNQYLAAETEQTVERAKQFSDDPATAFAIRAFDSARERYMRRAWQSIDERFGSTEAFLEAQLGIGAYETAQLREKYLV